MPITKSAQKQVRKDEKRQLRNRSVRSMCRTSVTKARRLIAAGELESARDAVGVAITALDKAAEKGIIHPNNASRRKARLMKRFNQAIAS